MTSRFTKRNRSTSKLDGYSNGDQATLKRAKDLEKALEERDKKIAELEGKIQELTGELERRKRVVESLTSDRNDLRQKNASLVNKLAELSRKQSVSSFTTLPSPPRLPRRGTELPPTPSTPDTPFESPGAGSSSPSKFHFSTPNSSFKHNGVRHFTRNTIHVSVPSKQIQEESDTDYSDMEDTETTSTAVTTAAVATEAAELSIDNDKSEFVNSGMVRESEVDSVLAAVQQTAINMQSVHANSNSYNSMSSPKVAPENSRRVENVKGENVVDRNPSSEDLNDTRPHRESVGALTARFERVASTGKMSMSTPPPTKHRAGAANHQGSPHSPSAASDATASDSSPPEPTVKRSSSLRDENGETPVGKHNRTPSTRSAGHPSSSDSKRVNTGSASIASKINSLIADRRSPKMKTSPLIERRDISTTSDTSSSEHYAVAQTEPEASITTAAAATSTSKMAADFKDVRTATAPSPMLKNKQDSIASSIGSEMMSSGDYSTTDIDSSFDFTSPLTSPASSLGASSIHEARKAAVKRKRDNIVKKSARFTDEIEEEDGLGELMDSKQIMRLRTKTLSSTSGVSTRTTVELGRITKRAMKERQFARHKRHHSLTDLRLIRGEFTKELELISPDFESKIKERIQHGVAKKYGGLERANQAAIKIQQFWRQYKLKSRFQKIKQQNKSQLQLQMRKRAQSMRDPKRRPSIMRKRYNRENSVQHLSAKHQVLGDLSPRQERRALGLANIRTAPTQASGEKFDEGDEEEMCVVQERAELSCTVDSNTYSKPPTPSDTPTTPVCQFKLNDRLVVTEPPIEPEPPTTPQNSPDGLTSSSSYTSGEFLTTPRPLSVFSTGSSVSPSGSYQNNLHAVGRGGRTMPRLRGGMVLRDLEPRDRSYSVGSGLLRKKSIGINHFNRKPTKGIQYLVESQVLDDDPNSVANFLTDSTKNKLSKQKIGEFVGEINSDFNMAVLGCLLEGMEMSGKPIDIALRELQQLFRMPGEAQKIDKIMEIFALEYFKNNKEEGAIKSEDGAYILSFAIMMLHTALHNPSVKHKTTKREWVSMNRGCNDGDNFPENFLLEIYERIQATEFICGRDHTQEVAEIEKQIIGATDLPKLTTPQRHLVLRITVTEVMELSSRPNFRQRHRRTLFVFNDMVIVCKQRRHEQYQCRHFFPLLHVSPVKFETEYHRNGLQLLSAIERKPLLQCTCDSLGERANLIEKLEEAIRNLEEMENERIEELGTSLSAKPGQDSHLGGSVRHNSTKSLRPSNSLASSSLTDLRNQSPMEEDEIGVNELGEEDGQLRPQSSISTRNNRSSGDSGFDSSQQDTPTTTPTPSLTEQDHVEATDSTTPSPSPSPSPSLIPPTSPHSLVPDTTIRHSKSHDGLRTLTVYPTTPDRSPSAELVRNSRSVTASPTHKKANKKPKDSKEKKKSHYVNIFSLGRSKAKDSKQNGGSPGGSPLHSRKRRASDSPQVLHNARGASPSSVNLSQSFHTASGGSGWYGTSASDHEDQS